MAAACSFPLLRSRRSPTYVARVTWHRDAEGDVPAADAEQVVGFETAGLANTIDVTRSRRHGAVNVIKVTTPAPNPTLTLNGPGRLTDIAKLKDGEARYDDLDPGPWQACAKSGGKAVGYFPASVCKPFTAAAKLKLALPLDRGTSTVPLAVPQVASGRRARVTISRYRRPCRKVDGRKRCTRQTVGRAKRFEITLRSPVTRIKLPAAKPGVKVTVRVVLPAFTVGDAPYLQARDAAHLGVTRLPAVRRRRRRGAAAAAHGAGRDPRAPAVAVLVGVQAVAQRDLPLLDHRSQSMIVSRRSRRASSRSTRFSAAVLALALRADDRGPHDARVRRQAAQDAAHAVAEDPAVRAVVGPEADDDRLRRVLREVEPQRLHALRRRPAGAHVERHLAVGDHLAEKRPHPDGERVADDQHLSGVGVRDGRRRSRVAPASRHAPRATPIPATAVPKIPAPRVHAHDERLAPRRSSSRRGSPRIDRR